MAAGSWASAALGNFASAESTAAWARSTRFSGAAVGLYFRLVGDEGFDARGFGGAGGVDELHRFAGLGDRGGEGGGLLLHLLVGLEELVEGGVGVAEGRFWFGGGVGCGFAFCRSFSGGCRAAGEERFEIGDGAFGGGFGRGAGDFFADGEGGRWRAWS